MLMTFLITVSAMAVLVAAMAVGVMFGRKPLQGSCGGLNAVGLNGECKICGRTTGPCEGAESEKSEMAVKAAALATPAITSSKKID
jgi:hypothetical protein